MKLAIHTLTAITFALSLLIAPATHADPILSIFSATYLQNGAWTVLKDDVTFGYSYGETNTEHLVNSLNTTGGCVVNCTNPTYPPCIRYTVVQADFETWEVTKKPAGGTTTIIATSNVEANAYTMRNSLRATNHGGTCPISG